MQRIFIGFVAFCATLGAAIGVFLFVSAVPYIGLIGKVVAGLLIVCLVCAAILAVVWTYSSAGSLLAKRRRNQAHQRVIVAGEVVAYLAPDGTFVHLSAQHEAAKIPMHTTVTAEPTTPDETILDLFNDGMSRRAIAKTLDIPYNRVQKLLEGK